MIKTDSGNAAVFLLGLTFAVIFCFLAVGVLIKAQMAHGAAAAAANAGALAATKALGEVFVTDITPVAQAKLDKLMQQLHADPLYAKGEELAAIRKHVLPSELQNQLLLGKRGTEIPLQTLLEYRPFFTEQELGQQLFDSFQQHAYKEIASAVQLYLVRNGTESASAVRFPVHGRIEVEARQGLRQAIFTKWLQEKVPYVVGKGHALFIDALDSHHISYDLSGLPMSEAMIE